MVIYRRNTYLYRYLVFLLGIIFSKTLHKNLQHSKVLLVDTLEEHAPEPCADSEHLKRFAEEEEMQEEYEAAGLYYQVIE